MSGHTWESRATGRCVAAFGLFVVFATGFLTQDCSPAQEGRIRDRKPPATPVKPTPVPTSSDSRLRIALPFIGLESARKDDRFKGLKGEGLTVAVLDTGLRESHKDFTPALGRPKRVPFGLNFTSDNGGDPRNAADGHGHGTHVAGIIGARSVHEGVAPFCQIIPLKVLPNEGRGDWEAIRLALDWVLINHKQHNITLVNMSIADETNQREDHGFDPRGDSVMIREQIRRLREVRIPVVVSAGNAYFQHGQQGMGFPAICRETISVGASYDDRDRPEQLPHDYRTGARVSRFIPDRLTPFSQRLHPTVVGALECQTDIFAPGSPIESTGISTDVASAWHDGTSQACPVAAGVILLMQELYQQQMKGVEDPPLPRVEDLEFWLRGSGVRLGDTGLFDGRAYDNVPHTDLLFPRINAHAALQLVWAFADIKKLGIKRQP